MAQMTTTGVDGSGRLDGQVLPTVIQGGMGVAVSSWQLAKAVARTGQLGVVSGTALDVVVARRLQDGDLDGDIRRALADFPIPSIAHHVLRKYFIEGGKAPDKPYAPVPKLGLKATVKSLELSVIANYAEVWLAKEGHDGLVGINFLEKIQMATPSAAYGAMLAGVDYVLMGAGIPSEIPRMLTELARHDYSEIGLHVIGGTENYAVGLDPVELTGGGLAPLRRPHFLAIVSSHVLSAYLAKDEATRPDGFVVEGPPAGGHNAPPRGRMVLDDDGQPIFGPRDDADLVKVADVGLPFWLAGGYGTPDKVAEALSAGAAGVQVGTLFSLSEESGVENSLRLDMLSGLADGTLEVRTDPRASPTGFPFKVATLAGTQSDQAMYEARPRLCDVGHLRVAFEKEPGTVGYRCPSEPVHMFLKKGGTLEETVGRKCLCNALLTNVSLGQTRKDGYREEALVTLGADLAGVTDLLATYPDGWTATEAVAFLVG
ncbi:nitronate monooxygenase [Pengzhenrongella frigida]|nr:nitronate monooxygenase [Cellulomonas sp. HLT2-17]